MSRRDDAVDDDAELLARVRADLCATRVHFNHAGTALVAAPVLARVQAHLEREAQIGGYEAEDEVADELAAVPGSLAPLLGAAPHEVTVAESATAASELVLWSMSQTFGWQPDDRILVDGFAYSTVCSTLQRLQLAGGPTVEAVRSLPDGTIDVEALGQALDERTRLVLVTHVPTHVGTVTDTAEVGRLLAGTDALYVVDVSQTLGQLPLDLGAIGCDAAFAPGRKFLRAPRGTAVVYVRAGLAERLVPLTPDFGAVDPARPGELVLPDAARRFDRFECSVAVRLGLGEAARYATAIGLDRIARLVGERSRAVVDLLDELDGVTVVGSRASRGIVSFVHDRLEPSEIRARLAERGINAWANSPLGAPLDTVTGARRASVRLSPHYVTDSDDLDRLATALRAIV